MECVGELLTASQVEALENNKFLLPCNIKASGKIFSINAGNNGNLSRFVDYSCKPNAGIRIAKSSKLYIVAVSDIKPNDEITF